jgi:hypothetical protein
VPFFVFIVVKKTTMNTKKGTMNTMASIILENVIIFVRLVERF